MSNAPRQLPTRLVEKVWGRDELPAPFVAPEGQRIGEIWFEPPAELPELLVKYLFTSEKLSVQVHPGDHNARDGEDGKEECWLVLDAEPNAKLAIGFDQEIGPDAMAEAARDGSIEDLLTWHKVRAGDVYYLPAGTVHAIGPGISLVEVQQNSDTTFRLYDYGRARELHLDRAMDVAQGTPYSSEHRGHISERGETLIDGKYFRLDRIEGDPDAGICSRYSDGLLALPLSGEVSAQDGSDTAGPGECIFAPDIAALDFGKAGITLLTRPQSK